MGVAIVCASKYAVMTQESWSRPPRSPTIVGSAVATMVWSAAATSMPRTSPVKIRSTCRRDRFAGAYDALVPLPSSDVALILAHSATFQYVQASNAPLSGDGDG